MSFYYPPGEEGTNGIWHHLPSWKELAPPLSALFPLMLVSWIFEHAISLSHAMPSSSRSPQHPPPFIWVMLAQQNVPFGKIFLCFLLSCTEQSPVVHHIAHGAVLLETNHSLQFTDLVVWLVD